MASSSLPSRIPKDSWDSHMHVTSSDASKYPLSPKAQYTPTTHSLTSALTFEDTIGTTNIVIVQPSIYGHDNACTLDALRAIGPRKARAVISLDPSLTTPSQLRDWHTLGVRGVRLNFKSVSSTITPASLLSTLEAHAARLAPFPWVIQLYIGLESIPLLSHILASPSISPALRTAKICIDHLGHPSALPALKDAEPADPYRLPGFSEFIALLKGGQIWTKLSAAYRIETDADMPWTKGIAREVLRAAPERVVFATDWPHTRFDGLDIRPFAEKVVEWCGGDEGLVEKVFKRNAEVLWDVER